MVTETSTGFRLSYLVSELTQGWVSMVYAISSSSTSSSTPVIVIVCGVFQFDDVNVTFVGEITPSSVFVELRVIETFAVGRLLSLMINVACAPASVVTNPLVGSTVTPATSSLRLVTETSDAFKPLYFVSVLVAAAVTIV